MVTLPSRRALSFLALVVLLHPKLDAQTTTSGSLTGVVIDQTGAVVPDADVEVKDSSKGTTQSTKTDGQGVYGLFFLAPGRYALKVAHPGFQEEKRAVNVLLGPPVSANVTLEITTASTTVNVTDTPLVQADNGDVSTTMNQKQISEVPSPGNDLTYIVQTAPGVVMNTDVQGYANFSVMGMPGTSNLFTIDGINNNDSGTNFNRAGAVGLFLGQNQVQEATVVNAGYSGQFGGGAGANINYITKSGGNEFHGNAQYYWNGRVLNANNWFNKAFGNPRPFDIANQWAGSFGGPLKKKRLFFFLDSEGSRLVIPQLNLVVIPSPHFQAATIANVDSDPRFGPSSATDAFYRKIFSLYNAAPGAGTAKPGGPVPDIDPTGCTGFTGLGTDVPCAVNFLSTRSRPSADTLTSGRVDWNLGSHDRAFLRVQYDHGLGAFYADSISPLFDADYTVSWWQGSVIETHAFGSSGAGQFLAAGSNFSPSFHVKDPSQALSAFPTTLRFDVPGTFTALGGFDSIGDYGRSDTKYQLSADIVQIRGTHKFGFGANFEGTWWTVLPNKVNAIGQLNPQTVDAFYQGGVDPSSPSTDFTSLIQSFTSQGSVPVSFFNFGVYGQDEWRSRPNLSLTFAFRAEHYSNPVCRSQCFARLTGPFSSISHDPNQPYNQAILVNQRHALFNTDKILWSPRFSFAWQPFGVRHNTVLRGGVGIFYDGFIRGIVELFYINAPLYNVFTPFGNNLTPEETTSLFKDAAASNDAFVNGFAAGQTLGEIQDAIPNFFPPAINASERNVHSPQFQRWSLELQQAFGTNTSLSIGYYGHHGIHEFLLNNSANAYCNPDGEILPSGAANPCLGFRSSLPLAVPDPRFSKVVEDSTNAVSNYNGSVVSFKHQFTRWSRGVIQANYTYGHAFDEISNGGVFGFTSVGFFQGVAVNPQDPKNLLGAYGPAEYDVRHSLNANYVWEVPIRAALRGRGPDYLVSGWQVSGTIFARTGFPYTVVDPVMSGKLAENNYSGLVYAVPAKPLGPGTSCGSGAAFPLAPRPCQSPQMLTDGTPNPNANFVQAGCETAFNIGNLPGPSGPCSGPAVSFAQGRNHFRGPSYFNTDFAIMKNTKIPGWENASLGTGLQFFNLFNHPNFGFPDNFVSSPTLGQIFYLEQSPTSILGNGLGGDASPRMIQVKAQLQF
jgi:hypothetical protein